MSRRSQANIVRARAGGETPQAEIEGAFERAVGLLGQLSACTGGELSTLQRRQLGGVLTGNTPALVMGLARALTAHAGVFTGLDLEGDGGDLRAMQERADAWRRLRDVLHLCAEQAGDAYLSEQAAAQVLAGTILERVTAEVDFARRWDRPKVHELERLLALYPVMEMKDVQRRRKLRAARRGKARSGR